MNQFHPERLLVAIGGNATHPENIAGTSFEQEVIAAKTAEALLPLISRKNELILTHGNGPVVGKILMRQELTRDTIAPMPLDVCVAHSQGGIAYILAQAIENILQLQGVNRQVACLLNKVEVNADDPAFIKPEKFIGQHYTQLQALKLEQELGWTMRKDADRGWRHVVPSPDPQNICDLPLIASLAKQNHVVIACGGGGIPVVRKSDGTRKGVQAVIDKDLTSTLVANSLGIETIIFLTAIPKVALFFGTPKQQWIDEINLAQLQKLYVDGHFPPGSMGPKIKAVIRFLEGGGKRAIITNLENVLGAFNGNSGTHLIK